MEKSRTDPGMYRWFVPEIGFGFALNSTPMTFGGVLSIFIMQR
jgi:hypothetical protein